MGRLWLSAVECYYQDLDRQLNEQFIHRLNDMEMLREIIWELTKVKVDSNIMSEKSWGAKSTIHSNEQYYRSKRIWQNENMKERVQRQSQKKHTDKTGHEADMQVL